MLKSIIFSLMCIQLKIYFLIHYTVHTRSLPHHKLLNVLTESRIHYMPHVMKSHCYRLHNDVLTLRSGLVPGYIRGTKVPLFFTLFMKLHHPLTFVHLIRGQFITTPFKRVTAFSEFNSDRSSHNA